MSKNLHVKGNYFTDAKATEGSKPSCQNHFNNRSIILSVDSTKRCFHFSYLLGKNTGTVPRKDGWLPYLLTNHEKTQLSSKTKQTCKHVCMALWSASKPPANFLHLLIWSFPHCVHPTALPCKALRHSVLTSVSYASLKSKLGVLVQARAPHFGDVSGVRRQQRESITTGSRGYLWRQTESSIQ